MSSMVTLQDLTFDIYPGVGYPDGESVLAVRGEGGILFVLRALYDTYALMGEREFAVALYSRSRHRLLGTGRYAFHVTSEPLAAPRRVLSVLDEEHAVEGIIMDTWRYMEEEAQREERERLGSPSGIYCTYDGCGMMIYGPINAVPGHDGPMCSSCYSTVMLAEAEG